MAEAANGGHSHIQLKLSTMLLNSQVHLKFWAENIAEDSAGLTIKASDLLANYSDDGNTFQHHQLRSKTR